MFLNSHLPHFKFFRKSDFNQSSMKLQTIKCMNKHSRFYYRNWVSILSYWPVILYVNVIWASCFIYITDILTNMHNALCHSWNFTQFALTSKACCILSMWLIHNKCNTMKTKKAACGYGLGDYITWEKEETKNCQSKHINESFCLGPASVIVLLVALYNTRITVLGMKYTDTQAPCTHTQTHTYVACIVTHIVLWVKIT